MVLSKEAEQARPKKPLSSYFYWRMKRLAELKDEEHKMATVNAQWKKLSEEEKTKLKDVCDKLSEEYHKEYEKWKKKFNVTEEDEQEVKKRKSKSKKKDHDDEDTKPEKTKGDKKKKSDAEDHKGKSKDK